MTGSLHPDTERGRLKRLRVQVSAEAIAVFCRKHRVRRLSLFGSVLRDDFGPESDVDALIEFDAGHIPGLAFFGIQEELSRLIGHRVDLNTPGELSPYFKEEVLSEAEPIFVAA